MGDENKPICPTCADEFFVGEVVFEPLLVCADGPMVIIGQAPMHLACARTWARTLEKQKEKHNEED
jgi:hypothetical protein